MASAIEKFLYGEDADFVTADGDVGGYSVVEVSLTEGLVSLRIASDRKPLSFRWVRFAKARLQWFSQNAAEPDDLLMPWPIVGFHSEELPDKLWMFNLNCWHSRWTWNSLWPDVENS